jgi:hypothetical protein
MKLKELLNDTRFTIPFNNFYNSSAWWLLVKSDIYRMMRVWYGKREILDYLVPGKTVSDDEMAEIADCIDLTIMSNKWKYDHMYSIYVAEYNPIWNYDGMNERTLERNYTESHTGTDTSTNSGTDTVEFSGSEKDTHGGSIQNSRTTYDSATSLDTDKTTDSTTNTHTFTNRKNETTHGLENTLEYDSAIGRDETEHEKIVKGGNQGTTTTQQMMQEEIEISIRMNLLRTICHDIVFSICYV